MSLTSTPASSTMDRARAGYLHDVMLWSVSRSFVAATADFIRQGLAAGEATLVALPAVRLRAVRSALGAAGSQVRFAEMETLGANPARIIQAWVDFVAEAGGRPARGVGEPLWAGRTGVEVSECQLHEALLNVAIPATASLWLRCPYEVGALDDDIIEEALHSHPWVADSDGAARANGSYAGRDLGAAAFAARLPDSPDATIVRTITPDTLRTVRDLALHVARVCGISDERAADLGLALHELGVNTVVHGRGSGTCGSGARTTRWSARSPTTVWWPTHWRGGWRREPTSPMVAGCGWSTSCATWCSCGRRQRAPRSGCTPGCRDAPAWGPGVRGRWWTSAAGRRSGPSARPTGPGRGSGTTRCRRRTPTASPALRAGRAGGGWWCGGGSACSRLRR